MIIGEVAAVVSPGIYIVRDERQRLHRAASAETWPLGSRVAVLDGYIVGRSGRMPQPRIYEV
jgi:hypothetical protein